MSFFVCCLNATTPPKNDWWVNGNNLMTSVHRPDFASSNFASLHFKLT